MGTNKNVELLNAEVDEDEESFFRIPVHGKSIEYITSEPNLYLIDMCFELIFRTILPDLPNDGLVPRNEDTEKSHTIRTEFPSVTRYGHDVYGDYGDIAVGEFLRGGIYEATCP
ncbi:hypothetical protein BJX68DRAFT_229468 [Aspergillus pseudodeflectus]|uniref:Protein kinase domain-containing protein n=1 Tax=Aspergillus pseudodeflectus TaxID=176178 RepID=A0ABR4KYB0_9EURO